ncbi:MAG: hypothetical protein IPF40_15395 [Actinomycetales bacterium]|uniref:Uncharacterized protein n=1 Tax=Candidatus Phosphoribacter hodrii TaxID=2953743 RepID=A0A934X6W8_9MICO|nr:hypothetical protein [Candidatus Phosphoribacter hodrii]
MTDTPLDVVLAEEPVEQEEGHLPTHLFREAGVCRVVHSHVNTQVVGIGLDVKACV